MFSLYLVWVKLFIKNLKLTANNIKIANRLISSLNNLTLFKIPKKLSINMMYRHIKLIIIIQITLSEKQITRYLYLDRQNLLMHILPINHKQIIRIVIYLNWYKNCHNYIFYITLYHCTCEYNLQLVGIEYLKYILLILRKKYI